MTDYSPADVRAWALDADEPVAARGRLGVATVTAYLKAHPGVARAVAGEYDVAVPARGAVSLAVCEELATLLR